MEEHGVLIDVLQEVLARRFAVFIQLQFAVGTVQVQHRIQRMVIQRARLGGSRSRALICRVFCSYVLRD